MSTHLMESVERRVLFAVESNTILPEMISVPGLTIDTSLVAPRLGKVRWQGASVDAAIGEYLVTFDNPDGQYTSTFETTALPETAKLLAKAPFTIKFGGYLGVDTSFKIIVPTTVSESTLRGFFSQLPRFTGIDPNLAGTTASITVNDPDYWTKQGWQQKTNTNGTGGAWEITEGSNSTVIAVLDSGVDLSHEDLNDNIYRDPNGNVSSRDFVDPATPYSALDENGHGTNVAGIILAEGNTLGGSGVMRKGKVFAVRVTDKWVTAMDTDTDTVDTTVYLDRVAKGINYVCQLNEDGKNVRVINASLYMGEWYYDTSTNPYSALTAAIARARTDGIVIVTVAGNGHGGIGDNIGLQSKRVLPASLSDTYDNIISVAATGNSSANTELAGWSNYGTTTVQLAAPGELIWTTLLVHGTTTTKYGDRQFYPAYNPSNPNDGGIGNVGGTSMAAPQVAGAIGLMLSLKPDLTIAQIRDVLQNGLWIPDVQNYPSSQLRDMTEWHGRLDCGKAITYLKNTSAKYLNVVLGDDGGNPANDEFRVLDPKGGANEVVVQKKVGANWVTVAGGTCSDDPTKVLAIFGLAGNDTISVVPADAANYDPVAIKVYFNGGSGDDSLTGGDGADTLIGENGNDTINGAGGNDTIVAGRGNDTVDGNAGYDVINGNDGNDVLLGGKHGDTLYGDGGADSLYGYEGNDSLRGGDDADVLWGDRPDGILTDAGLDKLYGDAGTGNRFYALDSLRDDIFGNASTDHLMQFDDNIDYFNGLLI